MRVKNSLTFLTSTSESYTNEIFTSIHLIAHLLERTQNISCPQDWYNWFWITASFHLNIFHYISNQHRAADPLLNDVRRKTSPSWASCLSFHVSCLSFSWSDIYFPSFGCRVSTCLKHIYQQKCSGDNTIGCYSTRRDINREHRDIFLSQQSFTNKATGAFHTLATTSEGRQGEKQTYNSTFQLRHCMSLNFNNSVKRKGKAKRKGFGHCTGLPVY